MKCPRCDHKFIWGEASIRAFTRDNFDCPTCKLALSFSENKDVNMFYVVMRCWLIPFAIGGVIAEMGINNPIGVLSIIGLIIWTVGGVENLYYTLIHRSKN